MSDKELLELAAKAAGIEIDQTSWGIYQHDHRGMVIVSGQHWNPLIDDGDALRLAVKLNLEIERSKCADRAYAGSVDDAPWVEYVNNEQGIYQATRRAIVCAAAAVGEAME